jgi:hypothetical protein
LGLEDYVVDEVLMEVILVVLVSRRKEEGAEEDLAGKESHGMCD